MIEEKPKLKISDFESKYNGWHKNLSYVKSTVRIFACFLALMSTDVKLAIGFISLGFMLAELIGIAEEWV